MPVLKRLVITLGQSPRLLALVDILAIILFGVLTSLIASILQTNALFSKPVLASPPFATLVASFLMYSALKVAAVREIEAKIDLSAFVAKKIAGPYADSMVDMIQAGDYSSLRKSSLAVSDALRNLGEDQKRK